MATVSGSLLPIRGQLCQGTILHMLFGDPFTLGCRDVTIVSVNCNLASKWKSSFCHLAEGAAHSAAVHEKGALYPRGRLTTPCSEF